MLLGQHLVFALVLGRAFDHATLLAGLAATGIGTGRGDRLGVRTSCATALLGDLAAVLANRFRGALIGTGSAVQHGLLTHFLGGHPGQRAARFIRGSLAGAEDAVQLVLRHQVFRARAGTQGRGHAAAFLGGATTGLEAADMLFAFTLLVGVLLVRVGQTNLLLEATGRAVCAALVVLTLDLAAGLERAARDRAHPGLHIGVQRLGRRKGRAVNFFRRGTGKAFCLGFHGLAQAFCVHCDLLGGYPASRSWRAV